MDHILNGITKVHNNIDCTVYPIHNWYDYSFAWLTNKMNG